MRGLPKNLEYPPQGFTYIRKVQLSGDEIWRNSSGVTIQIDTATHNRQYVFNFEDQHAMDDDCA